MSYNTPQDQFRRIFTELAHTAVELISEQISTAKQVVSEINEATSLRTYSDTPESFQSPQKAFIGHGLTKDMVKVTVDDTRNDYVIATVEVEEFPGDILGHKARELIVFSAGSTITGSEYDTRTGEISIFANPPQETAPTGRTIPIRITTA